MHPAPGWGRARTRSRALGRAVAALSTALLLAAAARPATRAPWDDAEWAAFHGKAAWALGQGLDTVPMGAAMAAIGRTFVGTPYVPHTLEPPGPERLVIGFRGLDCVTFVENVLALTGFIREPDARQLLERRGEAEERYERILTRIRYRGGELRGYPSRLHYFSDWIADGEAKGLVRDVTRELGGVRDTGVVDFMTTHRDAYRQLMEDSSALEAVQQVEQRLSAAGRWWIPEDALEAASAGIRDGDIIAATSTAPGMDVAHTGLALWVDGSLRLMHAPLVGDSVEISAEPIPTRVRRIRGQDGIMVARPCGGATSCTVR
ncbi:MAG TPA: N-acetylmuramoyl-L-alanine amidase-like domain-containing protein [Longimicrobiales bacterium]|nr:N-acetylmuramoyl-L-alanine amidase-like domain-containing protein [Longimicrobiales bacterium]